jgi:hypothetical protein
LIYIFPIINFSYVIFRKGERSYELTMLMYTVWPLQGFFNAMIYSIPIIQKIIKWIKMRNRRGRESIIVEELPITIEAPRSCERSWMRLIFSRSLTSSLGQRSSNIMKFFRTSKKEDGPSEAAANEDSFDSCDFLPDQLRQHRGRASTFSKFESEVNLKSRDIKGSRDNALHLSNLELDEIDNEDEEGFPLDIQISRYESIEFEEGIEVVRDEFPPPPFSTHSEESLIHVEHDNCEIDSDSESTANYDDHQSLLLIQQDTLYTEDSESVQNSGALNFEINSSDEEISTCSDDIIVLSKMRG